MSQYHEVSVVIYFLKSMLCSTGHIDNEKPFFINQIVKTFQQCGQLATSDSIFWPKNSNSERSEASKFQPKMLFIHFIKGNFTNIQKYLLI